MRQVLLVSEKAVRCFGLEMCVTILFSMWYGRFSSLDWDFGRAGESVWVSCVGDPIVNGIVDASQYMYMAEQTLELRRGRTYEAARLSTAVSATSLAGVIVGLVGVDASLGTLGTAFD